MQRIDCMIPSHKSLSGKSKAGSGCILTTGSLDNGFFVDFVVVVVAGVS